MSADNGIYIGCFPTESGSKEYRVIYAMAIDNVFYRGPDNNNEQLENAYRASYFGKAACFYTIEEARKEAQLQADFVTNDLVQLEYGMSEIIFDRPLVKMTEEEIEKITGW